MNLLNLPFKLVYSSLQNLQIKIPYSKISTQPIEIIISEIYLIVNFNTEQENLFN